MTTPRSPSRLRRIRWQWIQWTAIAIAVVALGLRVYNLAGGDYGPVATSAAHQFIPVLVLLAASVGLRVRSSVQVLGSALAGCFTCVWLAYHVGGWVTDVLGPDNPLRLTLAIPLLEEAVKTIPLLIVVWTWRGKSVSPGIVDFGLAGMAVGGGFGFYEDLMTGRVSSSGIDTAIGWILPSVHTEFGLVAGHLVWTGLVGLAIGVALTRRWRRSWIAVAVAIVFGVLDHGTWNDEGARESWGWVVGFGWLPIALFVGGLVLALVSDTSSVRTVPAPRRMLPSDVGRYALMGQASNPIRRWHFATEIMRVTTGVAHARTTVERVAARKDARRSKPQPTGQP